MTRRTLTRIVYPILELPGIEKSYSGICRLPNCVPSTMKHNKN